MLDTGTVILLRSPSELWGMTFAEENDWRDHFGAIPLDYPE